MIKKLLLSLGTLSAVVAPIAVTVSCGTSGTETEYSPEEQVILGKVTASEAQKAVESDFLAKVLASDTQYNNAVDLKIFDNNSDDFKKDFIRTAKHLLTVGLLNDPSYLSKIYSTVVATGTADIEEAASKLSTQIFDKSKVEDYVNKLTDATSAPATVSAENANFINVLFNVSATWNPITLGIKTSVLKEMIIQNFLKINRDQWASVFASEALSLPDYVDHLTKGDTTDFQTIKIAMEKRMALKWEAKLDETDSTEFISTSKDEHNIEEGLALLRYTDGTTTTDVTKYTKWSENTNRLVNSAFKNDELGAAGISTGLKDLIGYQGVTSLPQGEEGLLFTEDGIKAQAGKYERTGVLEENKIINKVGEKVKYIQKSGTTFDLTFVKSLMPEYDKTDSVLKYDEAKIDMDNLRLLIIDQNSGLWSEALNYYTTEVKDATNGVADKPAISIDINNEAVAKIWNDKGLSYVKYVEGSNPDTTTK